MYVLLKEKNIYLLRIGEMTFNSGNKGENIVRATLFGSDYGNDFPIGF